MSYGTALDNIAFDFIILENVANEPVLETVKE